MKKLKKVLAAAAAATLMVSASPASALVIYQFWQGDRLVGQIVSGDNGDLCGSWGVFQGTVVIEYIPTPFSGCA